MIDLALEGVVGPIASVDRGAEVSRGMPGGGVVAGVPPMASPIAALGCCGDGRITRGQGAGGGPHSIRSPSFLAVEGEQSGLVDMAVGPAAVADTVADSNVAAAAAVPTLGCGSLKTTLSEGIVVGVGVVEPEESLPTVALLLLSPGRGISPLDWKKRCSRS